MSKHAKNTDDYLAKGSLDEMSASEVRSTIDSIGQNNGLATLNNSGKITVLDNVDNTSDANKPISTLTQNALNNKVEAISTTKLLSKNNWSTNEQTITVAGVTVSNILLISPDNNSTSAWSNFGIVAYSQTINSITFKCNAIPNIDITANIVIIT